MIACCANCFTVGDMAAQRKSPLNQWPDSTAEALATQKALRGKVSLANGFSSVRFIAGLDVGYDVASNLSHAAAVLFDMQTMQVVEQATAQLPTEFPYISGFLSFREIPALREALAKLSGTPDLLMVDGHGIAHPRRLGVAAHLGVLLDMPAIGVGKSRLTGRFHMPGYYKGDASPLYGKQERIGTVLRSKDNVNPLFISPGHKVDHETAVELVLACLTRYRLPEPTRLADKLSKPR